MVAAAKSVPRFLPTLTEVVRAPVRVRPMPEPEPVHGGQEPAGPDEIEMAIVESVRGQMETELGGLLHDAVAAALLEQVDAICTRLRDEIEPLLRQAVAQMVAEEIAARRQV